MLRPVVEPAPEREKIMSPAQSQSVSMVRQIPTPVARVVHSLDCSRALSDAICEVVVGAGGSDGVAQFDLARTMVLVPGGSIVGPIERNLLARARHRGAPLIAPTIVTPLMLASRFVAPTLPVLSALGSRASWREAFEETILEEPALAQRIGRVFGTDLRSNLATDLATEFRAGDDATTELSAQARARIAARISARMSRIAAECAAAMLSLQEIAARADLAKMPEIAAKIETLARFSARRDALLTRAGVADRDAALRDAVRARRLAADGFDRIVVLLADPEPVQRALLAALGELGVAVEICVHTRESIDHEGFPLLSPWEARRFPSARIGSDAIRMADGPAEVATAVIDLIRAIPEPRTTADVAVMTPDDESRRAIERALELAQSRAVRVDARKFASTRLGSLMARLSQLVGDGTMESLAAFIRHPDAARWLGRDDFGRSVAEYRAATLAGSWRDDVIDTADGAPGDGGWSALRGRILALVAPLSAPRAANAWARPLRAVLAEIVGSDTSGAFPTERARTIRALDRVLAELADIPAMFAVALECHEAIALLLGVSAGDTTASFGGGLASVEIAPIGTRGGSGGGSGDANGDADLSGGVTIMGWLDAGMADERHLILAGFADGSVPEGAVVDPLLTDDLRRRLGMPSSLRRAARDAWILDGILARAQLRRDGMSDGVSDGRKRASVSFVVPRRTAVGDPQRPSRFLLRVERGELPGRVSLLFPTDHAPILRPTPSASSGLSPTLRFPVTPPVPGAVIASIGVTAFKTYLQCPYLFQLMYDRRLRLRSIDERATELDPRGFGLLVHAAAEAWGREEAAQPRRSEDAAKIELSLFEHLDKHVRTHFPKSRASAVRVQIELARRRLARLATLQAEQAREGWRVHAVELAFQVPPFSLPGSNAAPMLPDAGGLHLTGRIDRIDQHETDGRWRALDYKTAANAVDPRKTHIVGGKAAGREQSDWKDLQLPLYRVLLRSLPNPIVVAPSDLGYINLAPSVEKSGFVFFRCSVDEAAVAEEVAGAIVARVQAGDFTPSSRIPIRPDDPIAAIWGLGMRADDDGSEGDE
jgi:ATP-dependent helicase/nuclease subunit B